MKAAIYARVSTEEQAEEGHSISAQLRACREYCNSRGWEIVGEYVDEGKSAHTDAIAKRPAFHRMMTAALSREFTVLVVHKFDRFSRSMVVTVEAFRALAQASCGFVSITEQFDYTTPQGLLFLHMLAALAEFYSRNLSQETRKGKRERKAQGLYNGLLPFGVVKGADGLPIRDERPQANGSTNYAGLLAAYEAAANGATDAEVAKLLNSQGYRTTGNRGANLFRKDTVRRFLTNRFYLGELPDGKGNWMHGRHAALLSVDLFDRAQRARGDNRTFTANRTNGKSRVYSLTGLLRCWYCEQSDDRRRGAMRIRSKPGEEPRTTCYSREQGIDCPQRSVFMRRYEDQIGKWLAGLEFPEDIVEKTLAAYQAEGKRVDDTDGERKRVGSRLERLREMYLWGDIERWEYLAERDQLSQRLRILAPESQQRRDIHKLLSIARSAYGTWQVASQEHRNKVLAQLVQKVIVKDGQVVAIVPRPDFALVPGCESRTSCGSDGDRCPERAGRYIEPHNMLPAAFLCEIAAATGSIRGLARQYGTSRQTVRRALALAK